MNRYRNKPEPNEPKSSVNKRHKLLGVVGGLLLVGSLGYDYYNSIISKRCQNNETVAKVYLLNKGRSGSINDNVKNLFAKQGQEILIHVSVRDETGLAAVVLDMNKERILTRHFSSRDRYYQIGIGKRFHKGKYDFRLKVLSICGYTVSDKAKVTVEDYF